MTLHNCELCGQPVRVVGETTLHYDPVLHYASAPEELRRPSDGDLIKSLETTVLEQSDQIESLSAECERYRREIEELRADGETITNVYAASKQYHGEVIAKQDKSYRQLAIERNTYRELSDNLLALVEDQWVKIERLTWEPHPFWPDDPTWTYCRHCEQYLPQGHAPGCPAGEE